jgi:putative membrane protein
MRALGSLLAASAILASPAALAHEDHGAGPPQWTWEPWIVAPLILAAVIFGFGLWALQNRAAHGDFRRRGAVFFAGWLVLAVALVSPLHEAGERSFSAHMFEHELIMLAAAPLLVIARPAVILMWGFPGSGRQIIGRAARSRGMRLIWERLTEPVTATVLQAAVLWGWHSPALFDLALENEAWHAIQHASFLVSALLFWTAMLDNGRDRSRQRYSLAAFCLFATSIISGALGALMAFSDSPWYAPYAALGMSPYGLSPAEDQQVAGLIMWVPGGLVHAIAALAMVAMLLRPAERVEAENAI